MQTNPTPDDDAPEGMTSAEPTEDDQEVISLAHMLGQQIHANVDTDRDSAHLCCVAAATLLARAHTLLTMAGSFNEVDPSTIAECIDGQRRLVMENARMFSARIVEASLDVNVKEQDRARRGRGGRN